MTQKSFIESARTRAAKLAAAAARLKSRSGERDAAFCLAFMTDRRRAPPPELIARALPPGTAVILRDYDDPARRGQARRLKSICTRRGLIFIIGADLKLAQEVGADGLHLPGWADPFIETPAGMIKTVACHAAKDLRRAADAGADLAFLSPAFPTASHEGAPAIGATAFTRLAQAASLPALALGGVNEVNASLLAGRHVAGLAAIGAFLPRRGAD